MYGKADRCMSYTLKYMLWRSMHSFWFSRYHIKHAQCLPKSSRTQSKYYADRIGSSVWSILWNIALVMHTWQCMPGRLKRLIWIFIFKCLPIPQKTQIWNLLTCYSAVIIDFQTLQLRISFKTAKSFSVHFVNVLLVFESCSNSYTTNGLPCKTTRWMNALLTHVGDIPLNLLYQHNMCQ